MRLWKIEASTQMVFRGRRVDQSMECCAMIGPQNFAAGDLNGSLNLFSIAKKKPVFSRAEHVSGVSMSVFALTVSFAGQWWWRIFSSGRGCGLDT